MRDAVTFRQTGQSAGRLLMIMAVTLAGGISVGCGGPQRAAPVDVELAETTLIRVLEHWQDGGAMEDFRQQSPEIVVQEALWSDGHTLQKFELTGSARAENANWFCEVDLTVVPPDGAKPRQRKVTYAVGTDPVLTVFHAML